MDDHIKQLLLLGREHYRSREFDKAEPLLRQVAADTNRYADVFDLLGVIAHGKGDFTSAKGWFEQALAINPGYTEARLNLMVALNDLGLFEQAQEIQARLSRQGRKPSASDRFARGKIANMHANLSQAYADIGMPEAAVRELERAVELCPEFPDLRTKLGVLYRDNGQPEAAREQLERAAELNPDYLQARLMLGVLLVSAGQRQEAADEFRAVLEKDPDNPNARMYLRVVTSQPLAKP